MTHLSLGLLGISLLAVGCTCHTHTIEQDFGMVRVAVTLPTGREPVAVTVGDFNKDGRTDFATANSASGTASVYRNNGDDTFTKTQELAVGAQPTGIVSGNFDDDGTDYADLVLSVLEGPGYVETYLGKNDGTFVAKGDRSTSAEPNTVARGDLDEDKWDDVIVIKPGQSPPRAGILNNKSDGGFETPKDKPVKAGPVDVAIFQFGGAAYEDFAVVNRDADSVSAYLRLSADGTQYSNEIVTSLTSGAKPTAIAFGDLNGDGKADAVVTNSATDNVSVLIGNGDGTFKVLDVFPEVGDNPVAVDVADINRDGNLDAAVANRDSGTVSILIGRGDGTFQSQRTVTVGSKPSDLRIAPLGDSASWDIVVTNRGDDTVSVILF
ncbi:MAG: VCBS repeat-containing protein [Phycisphaerales bacterium]